MRKYKTIAIDFHGTLAKRSALPRNDEYFLKLCAEYQKRHYHYSIELVIKQLDRCLVGHNSEDIETFSELDSDLGELTRKYIHHTKNAILVDGLLYSDTIPAIDTLHKEGYNIVVQSNSSPYFVEQMLKMGLEGHVDGVVSSSLLHLKKPHPEFFKALARDPSVNHKPCDIVGIDNEVPNLYGMRKASWGGSILIDREGYNPGVSSNQISTLEDLPEIIERMEKQYAA